MVKLRWLIGVLALSLAAAGPAEPGAKESESAQWEKLAGVWHGFTVDGKGETPDRGPIRLEITVKDRTMHGIEIKAGDRIDHGQGELTLKLDAEPKQLDAAQTDDRGRTMHYRGIYRLEGDTLKWCVSPQKGRPETFETKKGQFLLVLKREKKQDKA